MKYLVVIKSSVSYSSQISMDSTLTSLRGARAVLPEDQIGEIVHVYLRLEVVCSIDSFGVW